MATRTPPDHESLHIEIYVSREPGSLSVSSYSDFNTNTLTAAIAEARQFIKDCRRMQRHIATHGVGVAPPRPPHSVHMSTVVTEAWDAATLTRMDGLFRSPALFQSLVVKR